MRYGAEWGTLRAESPADVSSSIWEEWCCCRLFTRLSCRALCSCAGSTCIRLPTLHSRKASTCTPNCVASASLRVVSILSTRSEVLNLRVLEPMFL